MRRRPAIAVLLAAFLVVATAHGASIDALRSKVETGRGEAEELGSRIRATQEQVLAAEGEAAVAARRERRLSVLLAKGRERAAYLAAKVVRAERHLTAERARLRRARGVLARRLVAIYEAGTPDTASVVLASSNFEELATRSEYLQRIEDSDAALAARVRQVRNQVRHELELVAALKARVEAYNERLAVARSEIAAVRAEAESAAARLDALSAERSAALAKLKDQIGEWVSDIETAEAASRAAAEETVGRWLGGPYAIPTYIVMCESGGNYSALNPSSGAGGAYQILPSTWTLYGGEGLPQDAPKTEQDRIAGEIWADSGGSAWVCAG
ncbi:MAG TPA: transglycosylase family protein [Solirubrobacterales bacterium]|jgi:septal ring factor EnvC (AmiA/AmiB activator)|nr:transglycosylase family protein [Solirubrobacterales bacterium]